MKAIQKSKEKIKVIIFLLVCMFFFLFQFNSETLRAMPLDNSKNLFVTEQSITEASITEELRLKVPAEFKKVWLSTEKKIWETWLSRQDGFLGRQIFWDKEKEEALVLIYWKNKKLWKSISTKEVNEIQNEFEENVKKSLNLETNPFPLIYEGELVKQG